MRYLVRTVAGALDQVGQTQAELGHARIILTGEGRCGLGLLFGLTRESSKGIVVS